MQPAARLATYHTLDAHGVCPATQAVAASGMDGASNVHDQHPAQHNNGPNIEDTAYGTSADSPQQWDNLDDDLALDANVIELDDGDEYSSAEVDAIELQAALLAAGSARLPAQVSEDEGSSSSSSGRWEGDEEDDVSADLTCAAL